MNNSHDPLDTVLSGISTVLTYSAIATVWLILALTALRLAGVW